MYTNDLETRSKLEAEIIEFIDRDNINSCTVSFQYINRGDLQGGVTVYVTTHNPIHNNTFLYGRGAGYNEVSALRNLLSEIKKEGEGFENNYTVQWSKINGPTQTSYFFGKDIHEVLNKFEHGKKKEEYVIFEIKLNPIA